MGHVGPLGPLGWMKTLRVVDDGEHDERVEEREESAWSELERLHAESHWDPLGPIGTCDADGDAQ